MHDRTPNPFRLTDADRKRVQTVPAGPDRLALVLEGADSVIHLAWSHTAVGQSDGSTGTALTGAFGYSSARAARWWAGGDRRRFILDGSTPVDP